MSPNYPEHQKSIIPSLIRYKTKLPIYVELYTSAGWTCLVYNPDTLCHERARDTRRHGVCTNFEPKKGPLARRRTRR